MPFLENIIKYNSKTAIICENKERVDYKTLIYNSEKFLKNIKERSLVFLLSGNNFETIVSYIGLLKSNCVIVFINENTNFQSLKKLINIYKPHYIFGKKKKIKFLENYILCFSYFDYSLLKIKKENKIKIHDQLKIMMPTSGSTGSEKYVRLSEINLVSNTLFINSKNHYKTFIFGGFNFDLAESNNKIWNDVPIANFTLPRYTFINSKLIINIFLDSKATIEKINQVFLQYIDALEFILFNNKVSDIKSQLLDISNLTSNDLYHKKINNLLNIFKTSDSDLIKVVFSRIKKASFSVEQLNNNVKKTTYKRLVFKREKIK